MLRHSRPRIYEPSVTIPSRNSPLDIDKLSIDDLDFHLERNLKLLRDTQSLSKLKDGGEKLKLRTARMQERLILLKSEQSPTPPSASSPVSGTTKTSTKSPSHVSSSLRLVDPGEMNDLVSGLANMDVSSPPVAAAASARNQKHEITYSRYMSQKVVGRAVQKPKQAVTLTVEDMIALEEERAEQEKRRKAEESVRMLQQNSKKTSTRVNTKEFDKMAYRSRLAMPMEEFDESDNDDESEKEEAEEEYDD
ncbi:hypothetical protein HDV05_006791 [Chytridiales sp. JEL 0842]|nr:hypothetical protein HDV05_006791 [Chytridiales sp. JEL 0842]